MAVSFTPNIGLAKPDDTEMAKNWTRILQLQDDNNQAIMTESNFPLTSYTPTIIAATSNPNVGAGTRRGEYQEFNGFIMGSFVLEFVDPSVSAGAGEWALSLPVVVDPVFHTVDTAFNTSPGVSSCIGEGYINDVSALASSGSFSAAPLTISGVSYIRFVTEVFSGKSSAVLTAAQPLVVATGDKICGSFFYKKQ